MKLPIIIQILLLTSLMVLCTCLVTTASADQKQSHQEGTEFAKAQAAKQRKALKSYNLQDVPGFKTDSPPEAGMSVAQLDTRKETILSNNKDARFLAKTINEKPPVKIDPINDPSFKRANYAASNPLQTIAEGEPFSVSSAEDIENPSTRHTCEESADPTSHVCTQTRHSEVIVPAVKTHIASLKVYSHGWTGGLSRNILTGKQLDSAFPHWGGYSANTTLINPLPNELHGQVESVKLVNGNEYTTLASNGDLSVRTHYIKKKKKVRPLFLNFTVNVEITYRPLVQESDVKEHIEDTCAHLEEKTDQDLCEYGDEEILEGPATKMINGYPVKRDWWKIQRSYRCHFPCLNNCEPYRLKGCDQVGTKCKTMVGDTCAVSEQTFVCRSNVKRLKGEKISGKNLPFCLDGNCSEPTYVEDGDMLEAVSRLAALKEMQGEITADNLFVFKGNSNSCKRQIVNFKDCCGSGKGWGKSLGLVSCSAEEKLLATSRSKKLCHQIGTFCSKKILGQCVTKETSFCCFPTKMAKIFHEQGRTQLGIGWGSPEHPECRGFTIQELSKIDFSKLDLQELYADIAKTLKKPDLENVKRGIQTRVDVMVLDTDKKKEAKVE
jgi:conjugal transfer mating pair stabilization protein TraN